MTSALVAVRRRRKRKKPVFMQGVFFFLLVVFSLYFFLHSPVFELKTVTVEGNSFLPANDIIRLSELNAGLNIWQLNEREIAERIELHPRVAEAKLKRRLPSQVVLTVREREPAALISWTNGFWLTDDEGVVLESVNEIKELPLPLLTGVNLPPSLIPGQKAAAAEIARLRYLLQGLTVRQGMIAEIDIANLACPVAYTREGLKIKLGVPDERVEEKLAFIEQFLSQRQSEILAGRIAYLDVTYPSAPVIKYQVE